MPRPAARPRTGRWLVLVLVLLAIASIPVPASADEAAEQAMVAATVRSRSEHGLGSLSVAGDLVAVARRHSARMADRAELHHNPGLGTEVARWRKVGENVGRGGDAGAIHAAFLDSPSHRANVLDPTWTELGVGVVRRGDTLWITVLFRLPEGDPAAAPDPAPNDPPPTPDPAPDPAPDPTPEPDPVPEPDPDPAPEPPPAAATEPDPTDGDHGTAPRHEVVDRPVPRDRTTVTLARLEAAARSRPTSLLLPG